MEPGILHDTAPTALRRPAPEGARPEDCPISHTLEVMGGRWKGLALYYLRGGTRRFNELRRLMPGVTQRMLTQTLRDLERHGVIRREIFPEVPPRVEYTLTGKGESLVPLMEAMAEWGRQHR